METDMANTKTPTRAELIRQVDEIDAGRVAKIIEILDRPEVKQAAEDLKALIDPSEVDKPLMAGSAAASVNSLLKSALMPLETVPSIASKMASDIDARLNPPEPVETSAIAAPAPQA
jgi:hypothetical protein